MQQLSAILLEDIKAHVDTLDRFMVQPGNGCYELKTRECPLTVRIIHITADGLPTELLFALPAQDIAFTLPELAESSDLCQRHYAMRPTLSELLRHSTALIELLKLTRVRGEARSGQGDGQGAGNDNESSV